VSGHDYQIRKVDNMDRARIIAHLLYLEFSEVVEVSQGPVEADKGRSTAPGFS